ncbi:DUF5339 family protein [Pseudomonas sp. GV071]|jgi:uncharacterized protein YgiB involved in biofilm formation|uniref:DUF5339 family protein n=1 Tax=Pseudomonas sp. GV071 TaxID=2135754 RepID=UPI000D45F2A1|nr:DUF5339 family protein [Pseudomonas sp. GV071]PTQ69103.1 hypothetical protein C8K61_109122 [Pseudomonas sp. GV071]
MKSFLTAIALIAMSSATMAADLGPSCTEYFKQIDEVVAANPQGEAMKSQYETAKKQMASMPAATQEAACKQASDMLKQAMAATPAN